MNIFICIPLDINSLCFSPSKIAIATLYIICAKEFYSINSLELSKFFKSGWKICLREFDLIYEEFLFKATSLKLYGIVPSIIYLLEFFIENE